MRYFAMITNWYLPKNNLHKAILEMAHTVDRRVLENHGEATLYINEFKARVEHLQTEHPRCKPVRLITKDYRYGKLAQEYDDLRSGIEGLVDIYIYQEKLNNYPENQNLKP